MIISAILFFAGLATLITLFGLQPSISDYYYKFNVRSAFVGYGSNLANARRLGRTDLQCYEMKFRVLKYMLRILVDYFDSDDYENINFFTKEEARDVMQHINNICGTNYMIQL